jgi:hypothetical protein
MSPPRFTQVLAFANTNVVSNRGSTQEINQTTDAHTEWLTGLGPYPNKEWPDVCDRTGNVSFDFILF